MVRRILAVGGTMVVGGMLVGACVADAANPESPDLAEVAEARVLIMGEQIGEAQEAAGTAGQATERVGEAAQDVTRAECIARWQYNLQLCNSSPPDLRPECWAACAGLLAGCLALSQG
jgi:hypothetical protein